MFYNRITKLRLQRYLNFPNVALAHLKHCPTQKKQGTCPGAPPPGNSGKGSIMLPDFERASATAPVRYGFLPENWFRFFYSQTGVSGPYVFGIVLINYWLSKEIFIMEHEYYLGLSIASVVYYVTTRFGPAIGKSLDSEIDAIEAEWEKGRQIEKDMYTETIKKAEAAQKRARGQSLLMDAKKENIAMQLEAVYRERMMHVYRTTKGRLDYHAKKYRTEAKIQQKWMIMWILENVRKSITPEFEKQALNAAIRDLAAAAGKARN